MNAVFLTHHRLKWRSTFWPVIIFGALTCLLTAYSFYRTYGQLEGQSLTTAGYLSGLLLVEGSTLLVWFCACVHRTLSGDKNEGLLEHNCLTPMKSYELVFGYVFGPSIGLLAFALAMALLSLGILLYSESSIQPWIEAQLMLVAAASTFALLGFLFGYTASLKSRSFNAIWVVALVLLINVYNLGARTILNFVIPIYPVAQVIEGDAQALSFFSLPLRQTLFTVLLHLGLSVSLYSLISSRLRAAWDFGSELKRATIIFALVTMTQLGLTWGLEEVSAYNYSFLTFLGLAAVFLSLSFQREENFSLQSESWWAKLSFRKTLPLALAMSAVGGLAIASGLISIVTSTWQQMLFLPLNFVFLVVSTVLWFEICQAYFARRARGVFVLGLFVLHGFLTFLVSIFDQAGWSNLLSPLFSYSSILSMQWSNTQFIVSAVYQLALLLVLFLLWMRQWKKGKLK